MSSFDAYLQNSQNDNEGETTSLLASSSAPPDGSRPRPTLDRPYNPRDPAQQPVVPQSSARQTLTSTALEEMERGAKRLADDNIDSDSVNGLLAGMEYSDDEASRFGSEADDDFDASDAPVTASDLEFLAGRASVEGEVGGANGVGVVPKSVRKSVDKIGNDLLGAHDDQQLEQRILRRSLKLDKKRAEDLLDSSHGGDNAGLMLSQRMHQSTRKIRASVAGMPAPGLPRPPSHPEIEPGEGAPPVKKRPALQYQVISMVALTLFVMLVLGAVVTLGTLAVGPPRQPVGPYLILEAQVGDDFWKYYDFYAGKDSAGSNGYITYVSEEVARKDGIIEVITELVPDEKMIEVYEDGDGRWEEDWMAEDLAFLDWQKRKEADEKSAKEEEDASEEESDDDETGGKEESGSDEGSESSNSTSTGKEKKATTTKQKASDEKKTRFLYNATIATDDRPPPKLEPFNPDNYHSNNGTSHSDPSETFVRISSSPTPEGPRNSVRLEGRRRFNRGLFIIDLRHMPAGCGTWPAFWLTDEANWPVNGEIDIVEGVNYQDTAKTALHTTRECRMDDVAEGSKTGSWDTAVGIPNRKTGIPDMTFRFAQNCFVYDPHQWINQGCVATDLKMEGRSLGMPLNAQGGGVYALEWDPVNRHIRTWVFSPHGRVPRNLREALRTATDADLASRVAPDTNQWGLPYGHFPIGEGTNCPSGHFRNMRLVINLAFCGSVSGNRYFMDCPEKFKKFKTCNAYVKSDPEELKEAYWKIRGVYVYERAWERQWT